MVEFNIKYKEINISSVNKEDTKDIHKWINGRNNKLNEHFSMNTLKELFLEYCLNECEIFLKITKNLKLIGIFKGRIEFKEENLIWISYFSLDDINTKKSEADILLNKILKYFLHNYGISSFIVGIQEVEGNSLEFFKSNGFKLLRVSSDFDEKGNIILMKKKILLA